MDEQQLKKLAGQLAAEPGPDGNPLFGGVSDPCSSSSQSEQHPSTCECGGSGSVVTIDLNRWLIAIGTGAEFHWLPTDEWVCSIPETTSRSMYQPTPIAALLTAVEQAVQGL